jgi:hypothetical protein
MIEVGFFLLEGFKTRVIRDDRQHAGMLAAQLLQALRITGGGRIVQLILQTLKALA